VAGSPEGVTAGRLLGGQLDGIVVEIEPGREVVVIGAPFLALFGGPREELERLRQTRWEYRYARVEAAGADGREAVFEFVGEVEIDLAYAAKSEPGA